MKKHRLAHTLIPALLFATVLVMMLTALQCGPARADMSQPFLQCPDGRSCMEHKVDYGYATIACTDADTRSTMVWGCEYEWGYQCRLGETSEYKKGGFLPIMSRLCDNLCGACAKGWE